jgi:hypothetical protein
MMMWPAFQGARRVDVLETVPSPSLDVYAFYRGTVERNCAASLFHELTHALTASQSH